LRRREFQPKPNDRYRTIPESDIIELLLLVSWAYEVEAGQRAAAHAAASEALNGWVGQGLGFRLDADSQRQFDPVEVINFMKWAGLTGTDPYWETHFVGTHRGFVREFGSGPGRGLSSSVMPPQRFRVTLRRSFNLQDFADGASVRLRAPLPLAGSYHSAVAVTPLLAEALAQHAVLRDQCLELRTKIPHDRTVTMGAEFLITATDPIGRSTPLTQQERELYLRESEGLIRVTPRIAALAAELTANATSIRQAVAAFWDYMMGTLCSGMIRYQDVPQDSPGDWVLENGWYDCQLGAALLASLCRARGIPARIVSGHLLYRVQPISHYWCEVWLDEAGWRPFDVICWDLSRGGQDCSWAEIFAGQIDYRLVVQCFPLVFTGPMSVHFPKAWQMMQVAAGGGVNITYTNAEDGSLIYRDHAEVERLDEASARIDDHRIPMQTDAAASAQIDYENALLF
jgi:transglutaminase-like putative cysteine protease